MRYGKKILYLFVCVKYRNPIYKKMALLTRFGELSIPFLRVGSWRKDWTLLLETLPVAGSITGF